MLLTARMRCTTLSYSSRGGRVFFCCTGNERAIQKKTASGFHTSASTKLAAWDVKRDGRWVNQEMVWRKAKEKHIMVDFALTLFVRNFL
jgi:hypothetical protein